MDIFSPDQWRHAAFLEIFAKTAHGPFQGNARDAYVDSAALLKCCGFSSEHAAGKLDRLPFLALHFRALSGFFQGWEKFGCYCFRLHKCLISFSHRTWQKPLSDLFQLHSLSLSFSFSVSKEASSKWLFYSLCSVSFSVPFQECCDMTDQKHHIRV